MLNATSHLHHILHNFFYGSVGNAHVHGPDSYHEVETLTFDQPVTSNGRRRTYWNNVPSVLDEFVQVGQMVTTAYMRVIEVGREMSQSIKYSHV
jgi:hypothetical protein